MYAPEAYQREVFSTAYTLRRTTQGTRYFIPHSGVEKIIVNLIDSDHGMQNTIIRVTNPWEAELENERGAILVV